MLHSLPCYLPFHQFHCMLIGKAGDVQAVAYHFDHRMAVFVYEASNIQGPLFRVTLHRFLPMTHVLCGTWWLPDVNRIKMCNHTRINEVHVCFLSGEHRFLY